MGGTNNCSNCFSDAVVSQQALFTTRVEQVQQTPHVSQQYFKKEKYRPSFMRFLPTCRSMRSGPKAMRTS